jgi:hypothetical protein
MVEVAGRTPISPAMALWFSPSSRRSRLTRPPRYSFRSGAGTAGTCHNFTSVASHAATARPFSTRQPT